MQEIDSQFLAQVIAITRRAGDAILAIYNGVSAGSVTLKSDGSPVTAADMAAHHIIVQGLEALSPLPIISEEAALPSFAERRNWEQYWLIDPLDGTKEFVRRNGEFTVNIALVQKGIPVLGVVHLPVLDETYIGIDQTIHCDGEARAEKYRAGEKIMDLRTRTLASRRAAGHPLEVVVSHRHGTDEAASLLQRLQVNWQAPLRQVKAGSSLKFCWLAEGRADFHPRLAPTCEWDTAAAQAVLVAAGGSVVDAEHFQPLVYNGSDSLLNPSFFALADSQADWKKLLSRS